jgi:hypothetical protein
MLVVAALRLRDLVPWRTFTIETSWSAPVAAAELGNHIGPGRTFRAPVVASGHNENELTFSRAINYRDSFLPVIDVAIAPAPHVGARLTVRIRLNWFVGVFMGFWVAGATLGTLGVAIDAIANERPFGSLALLGPLFYAGLTAFGFAIEARRAEVLLRALFPPASPPPAGPYR